MVENFITIYEDLPFKINGFVMYDAVDDYYTIVLNNRLSSSCNKNTFEHELGHILNGDFLNTKNVAVIEANMH